MLCVTSIAHVPQRSAVTLVTETLPHLPLILIYITVDVRVNECFYRKTSLTRCAHASLMHAAEFSEISMVRRFSDDRELDGVHTT